MKGNTYVRTLFDAEMDFANPQADQVKFHDIVHNLCNMPRYQGGTFPVWTVGAHSLHVSGLAFCDGQPAEVVRWAFMHDFHEAYTGDIPTPLKRYLEGDALGDGAGRIGMLSELETNLDRVICEAFDVPYPGQIVRDIVKRYDIEAREMEERWFRLNDPTRLGEWGPSIQAFMDETVYLFFCAGARTGIIKTEGPPEAEDAFGKASGTVH